MKDNSKNNAANGNSENNTPNSAFENSAQNATFESDTQNNSSKSKIIIPKNKIIIYIVAGLLACAMLAVAVCGHVFSRYASTEDYIYNQISIDDFYFTVDILGDTVDADSSTKTINVYSKDQDIKFSVCNYFDSLRVTQSNITYTVSYSSTLTIGSGSALKEVLCGNSSITNGDSNTLTYTNGQTTEQEYTLSLNSFTTAETITVEIKSSSPFTKTLMLVFNLVVSPTDVSCKIDNSPSSYSELIISSDVAIASGYAEIDWTNCTDLQFDNTNSYFSLDTGATSATSKKAISAEESVSVKFFKTDSSTSYTVSVTVDSGGVYTITIAESTGI